MVISDLQMALAGLGAAAVAGVWGYNRWQERQHRQVAERIFRGHKHPDVLLKGQADEMLEPAIPAASDDEPFAERREPRVHVPVPEEHKGLPPLPPEWADDIADCSVRIDFVEGVSVPDLWAGQAGWASHIDKPIHWIGLDEPSAGWRLLTENDAGSYSIVVAALQLADRNGPVADETLSGFLGGVQKITQEFTGLAELPSAEDILVHARALDEFCASVDIQLGVNVIAAGGNVFPGMQVRGLSEATGLRLRDDGLFHAEDAAGASLFTVGSLGAELFDPETLTSVALPGLTFQLDVPRVANGREAFDGMVGIARQFAAALDGVLVDAQRNPLSDAMIATIGSKIAEIQQRMAVHQIPPGSPRALRLFS